MKVAILFAAVLAVALGAPAGDPNAQVLRYDNDNIGIDGYNFAFDTSDGISRQEKAELKNIGTENEALSVQGEYSYIGDDGQTYKLTFVADENGFRPASDYLPEAF